MRKFEGKRVLITGTSRGIGRGLVEYFSSEGAFVYAVSRHECFLDYPSVCFIQADIADVDLILSKLNDDIDILVNNAGIICYENLMDVSIEEVMRVFSTNVFSTLNLSRRIVKLMIEKGKKGVIVNTHSFAASIPSVGSGIYAASKAALVSLTRTMAAEWAPYGIRVNGYSPGVIETEMTKPALEKNGESMLDAIALRKIGDVSAVTQAVGFLASDESSYLTGIDLDVSGGKFIVQNSSQAWKDRL